MQTEQQQLRQDILERHGWPEWRDNPWESLDAFGAWLTGSGDDLIALHTVNETPAGRLYVYLAIYLTYLRQYYASLPVTEPGDKVGRYGIIRLDIKQLTGKHINFPQEELSQQYIDNLVDLDADHPFQSFVNTLTLYFDGLFALKSLDADNHPQLQALINHTILKCPES